MPSNASQVLQPILSFLGLADSKIAPLQAFSMTGPIRKRQQKNPEKIPKLRNYPKNIYHAEWESYNNQF